MSRAAAILALLLTAAGPATRPAERRTYDCPRVTTKIVIDGKLDDWPAPAWSDDFVRLDGGAAPAASTRAKLAWDDDNLYVAAELSTPHVRATETHHDASLYAADDVFELFLDPDGDGRDYCELQVNARGTVMDLVMDKPYLQRGRPNLRWDVANLKLAISIDGTINDSSDVDRAWTVELAIPWKSLEPVTHRPGHPAAADTWRVQLARCDHHPTPTPHGKYAHDDATPRTYLAWSPQAVNNLHAPNHWGVLRFTSPRP